MTSANNQLWRIKDVPSLISNPIRRATASNVRQRRSGMTFTGVRLRNRRGRANTTTPTGLPTQSPVIPERADPFLVFFKRRREYQELKICERNHLDKPQEEYALRQSQGTRIGLDGYRRGLHRRRQTSPWCMQERLCGIAEKEAPDH